MKSSDVYISESEKPPGLIWAGITLLVVFLATQDLPAIAFIRFLLFTFVVNNIDSLTAYYLGYSRISLAVVALVLYHASYMLFEFSRVAVLMMLVLSVFTLSATLAVGLWFADLNLHQCVEADVVNIRFGCDSVGEVVAKTIQTAQGGIYSSLIYGGVIGYWIIHNTSPVWHMFGGSAVSVWFFWALITAIFWGLIALTFSARRR